MEELHERRHEAFARIICVWPGSVRYVAFGRTPVSARIALRIQTGLLPPSMTSVGIVAPDHWPGGSAAPHS
jgi:hypothetical protein